MLIPVRVCSSPVSADGSLNCACGASANGACGWLLSDQPESVRRSV
jgi:hypothetical protein